MKSIFLMICALGLQLQCSYGKPEGVGAFAYQDTSGNRYGGTYGLKDDGQVFNFKGTDAGLNDITTFGPNPFPDFQDLDSFFPEYFRNFENQLQEAFANNAEYQKKALEAAKRAFDLTSNQGGYIPNSDPWFDRFPSFPSFFPQQPMNMPGFGANQFVPYTGNNVNSAFAGGAVAPGFRHQVVALSPPNPNTPNINVQHYSDASKPQGSGGFYSVQSSSFVQSSNVNGRPHSVKGGETVVNQNGQVTKYTLKD